MVRARPPAPWSLGPVQRWAVVAATLAATAGCFTGAEGREPPTDRLYFPTGLLVSPGRTVLYVANSDFDLRYSGGWAQALDLRAIRRDVRPIIDHLGAGEAALTACQAAGRGTNADQWLEPGPCSPFSVAPYVKRAAAIGAFASGLLLVHAPASSTARLFAPVRGDPSITYFSVQDDRQADAVFAPSFELDCEAGSDGFCADGRRLGRDPSDSLRGVTLPADPVGIAATADGVAIVSAHQTQSAASLVVNDWAQAAPYLSYYANNLPEGPTEVAAIPEPAFTTEAQLAAAAEGLTFDYRRGFAITFRASQQVDLLRYYPDSGAVPPRPFIVRAAAIPLQVTTSGFDSRGIAIVDSARRACEASCAGLAAPLGCQLDCAEQVPLEVYVANRSPASLLHGHMRSVVDYLDVSGAQIATGAYEDLTFFDSVPLEFGASRVERGRVLTAEGSFAERLFAVCFDTRTIFAYDPASEQVELVIRTGRGPHDIAVDSGVDEAGEPYALLYVGHFTDSTIGVVDLDARHPLTYGQMVATLGEPTPPRESK